MNEKGLLHGALAGAAVVITLLVGYLTGWTLVTLLVGVVLAGVVLAMWFLPQLYRDREPLIARSPAAEPPPEQVRVGPVSLETATPEFRVIFSATVLWRPSRRVEPARRTPIGLPQHGVSPAPVAEVDTPGGEGEPTTAVGPMPAEPAPTEQPVPDGSAPAHPAVTEPGPDESTAAERSSEEPASGELASARRSSTTAVPTASGTVQATTASTPSAPAAETASGRTPADQVPPAPVAAGEPSTRRENGAGRAWHAGLAALATAAAVERAADIVRGSSAADTDMTAQQLASDLVWARTDSSGSVRWCAQEVELTPADPDDAERLRRLSRFRKQVHEWEQTREYEKNVRGYLGDDVLTTGGRALVWWLARHLDDDEAVQAAVPLIDDLSTLSAAAQDRADTDRTASPSAPREPAPPGPHSNGVAQDRVVVTLALLERLFPDSADQRRMFARSLASIAERSDRAEYAARLRTLFGVPDLDRNLPETFREEPQDT